jgi:hypothetical protein
MKEDGAAQQQQHPLLSHQPTSSAKHPTHFLCILCVVHCTGSSVRIGSSLASHDIRIFTVSQLTTWIPDLARGDVCHSNLPIGSIVGG